MSSNMYSGVNFACNPCEKEEPVGSFNDSVKMVKEDYRLN